MHNTQWPSCQYKCKQSDRQNPFSSPFSVVSQHKAQIEYSLRATSFLTLMPEAFYMSSLFRSPDKYCALISKLKNVLNLNIERNQTTLVKFEQKSYF